MGHTDLLRELEAMGAIQKKPAPAAPPVEPTLPKEEEPSAPAVEPPDEDDDALPTAEDVEDTIAALTAGFRSPLQEEEEPQDDAEDDEDLDVPAQEEEVEPEIETPAPRQKAGPYGLEERNFDNVAGQLQIITEELSYILKAVQRLQRMAATLTAQLEEE